MGWITLFWRPSGLFRLALQGAPPLAETPKIPRDVQDIVARLTGYFDGKGHDFQGVRVDLSGVPPFHLKVLEKLRELPAGQTLTYGQLALMVGSPGAARAVGQAMARNPIPIIIPCHRVVASNGPGGFSLFGSLNAKEELLRLDRAPAIL